MYVVNLAIIYKNVKIRDLSGKAKLSTKTASHLVIMNNYIFFNLTE